MLQPVNPRRPPYTRMEWLGFAILLSFAIGIMSNLIGCHADELRECEGQRASEASSMASQRLDDYARISALEDRAAEHESEVIAADLAGYERRMYEENAAVTATGLQTGPESVNGIQRDTRTAGVAARAPARFGKGQKQTAHPAGSKVWPQVLSVFTSTDPDKPDLLAGSSSAWPLPPGSVTMANMVPRGTPQKELPDGWARRRVRHTDFGVALRGVKRYTRARVCQVINGAECCATGPAITTGPWKALCRSPDDCASGQECRHQIGDITRPGDKTEYWRTTQIGRDGTCEHRGAVDVTPAFRDVCGFRSMRPVTVRLL